MSITLHIQIEQSHITAAQRSGGRLTPVEVAILQQTSYLPVGFNNGNIGLIDEHGTEFTCTLPADIVEFLRRFRVGQPVAPAAFTLDCAPLT